jgi:hypothetical protein
MLTSIAGSSPSFGSAFSGEGLKDGHGLATWNAARCVRAMFTVLEGWDGVLKPVVARYQGKVSRIYFRADAGFASPEVYEFLEAEQIKYAIRLPANRVLQDRIGYCSSARSGDLRTRCVGSMPISPIKREAGPSRAG